MKQYVIDELRHGDYIKLKAYFDENLGGSEVEGIYWIPLDKDILTDLQTEHVDCHPLYFAIDLEPNLLACEFLVRTRSRIRCDCMSYATDRQRDWIIRYVDDIFEKLDIKI